MRPLAALPLVAVVLLFTSQAFAYDFYLPNVPNSDANSCLTCHNNPSGGTGCGGTTGYPVSMYGFCRNVFGYDFGRNFGSHTAYAWDAALRDRDSDGDGRTNGQELVYFLSSYTSPDGASAGANTYVSLPGWGIGSGPP